MATMTRTDKSHATKSTPASKSTRTKSTKQAARARRLVARGTACTGLALLTLSLVDCTCAVHHLTGLAWPLAALLATGIDAGLVACEAADMVAGEDAQLRRWAYAGMTVTMLASMILNCVGVWSNAPVDSRMLATVFAGMIPCTVFIMGRITGGLMSE